MGAWYFHSHPSTSVRRRNSLSLLSSKEHPLYYSSVLLLAVRTRRRCRFIQIDTLASRACGTKSKMRLFLFVFFVCYCKGDVSISLKPYIVYLGGKKGISADTLTTTHYDLLVKATGSMEVASAAMIYSYKYVFSGFSARLTKEQADKLSRMPEVLSVHPNRVRRLFTTRSWDFLGLPIDAESKAASLLSEHRILDENSSDVIIGVLDTGIWPESESFRDDGMKPVPAKWKGSCVNDPKTNASVVVHCNRKLIGAKYYRAGLSPNASVAYSNPRDFDGHGTGTASIGAGMAVANASMEGLASGIARGGLRSARISAYKVCWTFQCYDVDIVAALDDAIHDGVDVISLSLGDVPLPYNVDIIAIGAFHALEKGILVSCACGNSGPIKGTVTNIAPWILTVGASSIDREITPNSTRFPIKPAPVAGDFSSRGPNIISPDIIKPDVSAPGVSILAAWSGGSVAMDPNGTFVRTNFAIASGTSFACPHATGTAAFVKSIHPSWSPAAIKSAIMTTVRYLDNTGKPITESDGSPGDSFSIGAGVIQPMKAIDPGLVYETAISDYILYLCSIGYSSKQVQNITGDTATSCPDGTGTPASLNYPSIGFNISVVKSATIPRTVTNVGDASSIYKARVEAPSDSRLSITVSPQQLKFLNQGEKLSFNVTISLSSSKEPIASNPWAFSSLTWDDGKHSVRSPIAVAIS